MAYKYRQPDTILSPRDAITKVDVLFDNCEFSVAKLLWYGDEKLGIRWNIGLREWDDPDKQNDCKITVPGRLQPPAGLEDHRKNERIDRKHQQRVEE